MGYNYLFENLSEIHPVVVRSTNFYSKTTTNNLTKLYVHLQGKHLKSLSLKLSGEQPTGPSDDGNVNRQFNIVQGHFDEKISASSNKYLMNRNI